MLGIGSCKPESTLMLFCALSFLEWNVIWLFDLVRVFKQPMHTTDQYMKIYKAVVYSISTICVAVIHYSNSQDFALVPTYTCLLYKENFLIWIINILQVMCLCLNGYTILRFGRDSIIRKFKKSGGNLESFFRTQKSYFFLCAFCWGLGIIFLMINTAATRQAYAIVKSAEPSILALPWITSYLNSLFDYKSSRQIHWENDRKKTARGISVEAGINKKVLDDVLRNEIVEYLLKGIRRAITASAQTRHECKEPSQGKSFFSCCSCFKEKRSVDSKANSVYNNNSNLREIRTIRKEARKDQAFKIPLDANRLKSEHIVGEDSELNQRYSEIHFVSLAPTIFDNIRKLHNKRVKKIIQIANIK